MNILIVSANTLPMSPVGAAGIAGAALAAGHRVTVFDCLPDQGDETRFLACLEQFEPDVVGLSIPLVTCRIAENPLPNGFSFTDIRPMLKRLVALVRKHTNAQVVAGGSGFNYFPADWLFCLDIEYGMKFSGRERGADGTRRRNESTPDPGTTGCQGGLATGDEA